MNAGHVRAIYLKELLETLRDRKTLLFMLVLPTIIMPIAMIGLSKFAVRSATQLAMEEVTIAADAESRANYLYLAHQHFLGSSVGAALKYATHPFAKAFVTDPKARELLDEIPREVFRSPEAYAVWARGMAKKTEKLSQDPAQAAEQLEAAAAQGTSTPHAESPIATDLTNSVSDTFLSTIQSVGLVTFVDPSGLSTVMADETTTVPAQLAQLNYGRQIQASIRGREIDGYLAVHGDLSRLAHNSRESNTVYLFFNSTLPSSNEAASRVRRVVEGGSEHIVRRRLFFEGFDDNFLHPIRLAQETNLATPSQQMFSLLGGLLPYLVLTFTYLGGFYPAIDLAAGEKERHTLETLLLTPMSRLDIALGKFLVLFTTSLVAALLGIVSLALSIWFVVPSGIIEQLQIKIDPFALLSISLLAIPPAAIFAGVFLSISIYARTFKEAQNYMAPLGLIALLPAAAAMLPGVEMNYTTALIPFVNLSLLARDFLKGDVNWTYYFITLGVSVVLAAMALAYSTWQFHRERVLFRT